MLARIKAPQATVRVGIIGKYVALPDAYLSVCESLRHAASYHGVEVEIEWIHSEEIEGLLAAGRLRHLDGMVIPGRVRPAGHRGQDRRGCVLTRARHSVPWACAWGCRSWSSSSAATSWACWVPTRPSSTPTRCTR